MTNCQKLNYYHFKIAHLFHPQYPYFKPFFSCTMVHLVFCDSVIAQIWGVEEAKLTVLQFKFNLKIPPLTWLHGFYVPNTCNFFCWLEVVSPWNFFNFFPLNGLIYNPVEFHLLQNMLLKQTLECNTKSYLEWISLITRLQIKVSHSLLNYLRIRSHYPLIVMIWVFLCLVCRKISCIKGKEWKGNRQVNN